MAAVDAVYPAARNPMAFPWLARGGLAAHKVRRLYLFWSDRSDTWVDVSATLDRKIDALGAHASQIHDPDGLAERIRTWAAEEGEPIGATRGRGACGWSSSTTTRRKGRADRRGTGWSALLEEERPDPAPVVPDLGQPVRAPPEHRHHLGQGQVAGDARQVLVGRDGHVAEQARRLVRGRPAAGCASGRGPRSRAPATGRAGTG